MSNFAPKFTTKMNKTAQHITIFVAFKKFEHYKH